jgi:multiple sugar transport system permease protein
MVFGGNMLKKHKEWISAAVYIFPSFFLLVVFSILPIGMDIYYSFTKYNVIKAPQWTGLDNYRFMFKDIYFIASLKNTIVYTLITVPLTSLLSLLLAAILAELFRSQFGGFIKGALFVPVIASSIMVGTLWTVFLSSRGPVNSILRIFNIPAVQWLGTTETALPAVAVVSIWKNVGYYLVICYAGIMDIPRSLYEAAKVDGANAVQRFFNITLPSMSTVVYLIVTLGIIWSFQVYDLTYIMTGGGPGYATQTLVMTIYNAAFKEDKMGYATAVALVLLIIVLAVTIIQKQFQRDGAGD